MKLKNLQCCRFASIKASTQEDLNKKIEEFMYYIEFYINGNSSHKDTACTPCSNVDDAKKWVLQNRYPGCTINICRTQASSAGKPSWFKG